MVDRPSVRVTSDFDHEEEEEGSASTLRSPIDVSFWSRQIFHQPQNPKFVIFLRSVPSWPRKDASLSSMPTEREITLKRMTAPVEYWTITPLTRFSTGTFFVRQSRGQKINVVPIEIQDGRTWLVANFWLCVWIGKPFFRHLLYLFIQMPLLKILCVVL